MVGVGETVTATFHPASALDYIPASQLRELQLARLQAVVRRAWEAVPLMRARMEEKGLSSDGVRRLEDVVRLPFTLKSDLRDTYPFGLFASPMQDIVRLHASSGTTGRPIVVAYTREDLEVSTSVMMRSFAACGLHEGDIVQNAYGYGLFMGGLGAHYGAESLGATVVPISGGNTDRQIMVMAVEVPDRPGGLADVLEAFEGSGINIEYMYAFPFARGDKAVLIFRFDRPDAAISLLQRTGINVIASVGAYRN